MAEKQKKKLTLEQLNAQFGTTVGDDEYIASGSIVFDAILSNGKGIPRKKFIQLSSDSGVGKTTSVLHFCKVACSKGLKCIYLDIEKGVNKSQLDGIGLTKYVNSQFFLYPISTFEEAEEVLDSVLEYPDVAYIVIDSITGLIPAKMLEKSVADIEPGLSARYQSSFLNKYKAKLQLNDSMASFIFINQMRNKLNFMGRSSYEAAGGTAQKFYMDIRLMMTRKDKLEKTVNTISGREVVPYGANAVLWAEKNRHNRPYVQGVLTIIFGKGISNIAAYQQFLINKGVLVQGGGGYFTLTLPGGEPIKARGSDGVAKMIREHGTEIKQYIDENGGFSVIEEDDSEA